MIFARAASIFMSQCGGAIPRGEFDRSADALVLPQTTGFIFPKLLIKFPAETKYIASATPSCRPWTI
ncbi:hypothetical protein AB4Z00_20205 [Novosphingobium sp. YAF33]